jgi:hypothetical protein
MLSPKNERNGTRLESQNNVNEPNKYTPIGKIQIAEQFLQKSSQITSSQMASSKMMSSQMTSSPISSLKPRNLSLLSNNANYNSQYSQEANSSSLSTHSSQEQATGISQSQQATNSDDSYVQAERYDLYDQSNEGVSIDTSSNNTSAINIEGSNEEWEEVAAVDSGDQLTATRYELGETSAAEYSQQYLAHDESTGETKVTGFAALALYDFETEDEDKISFKENDLIIEIEQVIYQI